MREPQREHPLQNLATGGREVLGRLPLDLSSCLTAKRGKWSPEHGTERHRSIIASSVGAGAVHGRNPRIQKTSGTKQLQLRTASQTAWQTADPGEGLDDALPSFTVKPWTGLEGVKHREKAGVGTRGSHQCGGRSLHGNKVLSRL